MTNLSLVAHFIAWRRLIIPCASAAMGIFLLLTGLGVSIDHYLRDVRDAARSRPASGEVHIIEVDTRSLNSIHRWPIPRRFHAAAVDRLRVAGARLIAFDVDFSSASDPGDDQKFAGALQRAGGGVILPTFLQTAGFGSSAYAENVPIKMLADQAFLGSVNVSPDDGGSVRQMLLGVATAGISRPSLPVLLAERHAEIDREFDIDFSINPDTIPRHSLVDLIAGRIPAAALRGKRVLIGGTAMEMGDRYAVPRHGVLPGVVIQALAAETLLRGPLPQTWSGLLPLIPVILMIAIAVRARAWYVQAAILATGTVLVLLLPLGTEKFLATTMSITPALGAAWAAAVVGGIAAFLEKARSTALIDADTGLPNLRALEANAGEGGANIVVGRIERFSAISSSLGPEATVKLLCRVAERLKLGNGLRQIYRTDDAALAWWEPEDEEESLGDRIDAIGVLMRAPVEAERLVDVALSFGVAGGQSLGVKERVAHAGFAATNAWQHQRSWEKFSSADSETANWQLSLLGKLDAAIEQGQLWNAYRPKLDLITGRIGAAEALVRWEHPDRGMLIPDEFMPLVEENGRACDITAYVIEQALDDALAWREKGFPLGVAVNLSANLLSDEPFIERIGRILQASQLPTNSVTIEVTEAAAASRPDVAIAALRKWRNLGVSISIDSYGTGQSSLTHLQSLPADELKIDQSFIEGLGKSEREAIMVRSTIALAHELGLKVVAEGVSSAACLQMLLQMGCDAAQGDYVGRPVCPDRMTEILEEGERRVA